jgi:hypothetical protein
MQPVNVVGGENMMNRFSDATWELSRVDSTPRTLTRATRTTTARTFFTPNWWSGIIVALAVLVSGSLVKVHLAAAQDVPSGTIEFTGGSVAAGIGYSWGKGILIFEGKHYPLKVAGLSILHVGASSYSASGTVYNLTKVNDINGIYAAASAGAAVAGGASVASMKNSKGVLITMTSTHMGVNFSLAARGVTISLYGTPF